MCILVNKLENGLNILIKIFTQNFHIHFFLNCKVGGHLVMHWTKSCIYEDLEPPNKIISCHTLGKSYIGELTKRGCIHMFLWQTKHKNVRLGPLYT